MSKGKRRERQAAEIYEGAGWQTFRPQESPYGETDMFGLFDLVAVNPNKHIDWVQVKANDNNLSMGPFFESAETLLPANNTAVYLICYDREGWRMVWGTADGNFETELDEREMNCKMGEGLSERLLADVRGP